MFLGMMLALYLIIGMGQNVQAKDWNWQRIPGTNTMFDTARITSISSSILRVWTKEILDKKVIDEYHKGEPVPPQSEMDFRAVCFNGQRRFLRSCFQNRPYVVFAFSVLWLLPVFCLAL